VLKHRINNYLLFILVLLFFFFYYYYYWCMHETKNSNKKSTQLQRPPATKYWILKLIVKKIYMFIDGDFLFCSFNFTQCDLLVLRYLLVLSAHEQIFKTRNWVFLIYDFFFPPPEHDFFLLKKHKCY
jgi:nicotinamide riboside transporter PnuC